MSGEETLIGCGIGPVDQKICHQSKTRSFEVIIAFYFILNLFIFAVYKIKIYCPELDEEINATLMSVK